MKPQHATLVLAAMMIMMTLGAAAPAGLACYVPDLPEYNALSSDRQVADAAIAALRDMGPAGLQKLIATWDYVLAEESGPHPGSFRSRLTRALDGVGAQRDNWAAKLYWYTDLAKAQAAAKESGRPILSLRLLGRLDEELSCANSRFMRTALYANREISGILRDRFILHWESVRPVPKISIDFGDGRSIVRTITGNSLHYVLDVDGRPLDVLPGLYGPGAFKAWLERMQALHAQLPPDREIAAMHLSDYHEARLAQIAVEWKDDLAAAGHAGAVESVALPWRKGGFAEAAVAARLTVSKAAVESPVFAAMGAGAQLQHAMSDSMWEDLAKLHMGDARLDKGSLGVMACKIAVTPEMVQGFERLISQDSVRNEYINHRHIHGWFARGGVATHQDLTERIYAELFLTPSADPWLGLVTPDTYAALQGNGMMGP